MSNNEELVGWQSDSGGRDTLDIIENCLLTIVACTWSIQHLNVPRRGASTWTKLRTKVKWAVFTIFFPEVFLAHAILELVMAWNDFSLLREKQPQHVDPPWWVRSSWGLRCLKRSDLESGHKDQTLAVKWTLTHTYFANMGGFYLVEPDRSEKDKKGPSIQPTAGQEPNPVLEHLDEKLPSIQNAEATQMSESVLLTAHLFAESWENFEPLSFGEEDLEDKSKTDYFSKAIAMLQISQLFLSLIVRKIRHLAYSQLETATVAFAVCGVMTYICYTYKPQDVGTPIGIRRKPESKSIQFYRTFDTMSGILTYQKQTKGPSQGSGSLDRIPNDNIPKYERTTAHYALYVLAFLTAGFGSIHATAWNFDFATVVEKTLWRTATLVTTLLPPLALFGIFFSQITRPWGDRDEFIVTCLKVMKEYCWQNPKDQSVRHTMRALERSYDGVEEIAHYKDIFDPKNPTSDSESPESKLRGFIKDNITSLDLPSDFQKQFEQLVDILDKTRGSQKLFDEALLKLYPRKIWSTGQSINQAIIYASTAIYCIARLSIIALAFSSLRSMPRSVYITTWTGVIPSWA